LIIGIKPKRINVPEGRISQKEFSKSWALWIYDDDHDEHDD